MRDAWLPPLLAAFLLWPPTLAQGHPFPSSSLSSPPVAAQGLTLPQALEAALGRHPELAAARAEVEAAEAALAQAGARPNPVLQAEFEDPRRDTRSTTVTLTQPIELGGKRAARQEAARRALALAESQRDSRRAQLRADTTAAFMDALAAQQRVALAESSLQLADEATQAAARRVQAGKVAPIDETRAQVARAAVRVEAAQARSELRVALGALAAMTGGTPADRVEGSLALPALPGEHNLQRRLASAPGVVQARLEAERLQSLARVESARRVPDLSVGIGAKRSDELGRQQPVVTLSIPLPVFDTARGAELEALRRHDKARHEAEATALRLQAEVAAAHERLRSALAEAQALQDELLPGAQAAHDAAARGFELGKFGFTEVLDAQRTLLQARTQHLRAASEARRAAAQIDRLLGGPDQP